MMDDDPVWYPLGGTDNVFRLNSELPHKRTPQSGILRSAYRAELEAPLEWSQNPSSASLGLQRSPNSNTPNAPGSARKVRCRSIKGESIRSFEYFINSSLSIETFTRSSNSIYQKNYSEPWMEGKCLEIPFSNLDLPSHEVI